MCNFMFGYLAVCKSRFEYFNPDLDALIKSLDPFDKPAKIYECVRVIRYRRDVIDKIDYTERRFIKEVK